MHSLKNINLKRHKFLLGVVVLLLYICVMSTVNVNASSSIPGCPGGPPGPPAPGTICEDGSMPHKDNSLPLGCPGSSIQGPVPADYRVLCPARPGRAECTYSASNKNCIDGSGNVIWDFEDTVGTGLTEKNNVEIDCKDPNVNASNCGIIRYILQFTNALSALVGVVVVIMIVVAGIQYSSSRDNPQAVAAARGKIVNAVMALVFYLFIYAFLQWVIPGGLF